MDSQRFEECGHPGTLMACPICQQSVVSCINCFQVHCDSHSFMRTVDSQGRSIQVPIPTCNFDTNRAYWFTADSFNVCSEHCEGREVFPLEQAAVCTKFPDHGIDILRRARKIDQVCEILRNIPTELEQTLNTSIEKDFQSAMDALSRSKEKVTTDLQTELTKLRSELANIIDNFEKQKFEETIQTTGTWLEETVLTQSLPEVQKLLESERWLLYSYNREAVRVLETRFCCLRRPESLLDPLPAVCEWKDTFYCLPGEKFQVVEIPSGEVCECGVDLQCREGQVWTGLPDGSFFFCGGDLTTSCMQLNSEFNSFVKIGDLEVLRSFPGIVAFKGSVYVFGGASDSRMLASIEEFSLRTRSSTVLPVEMSAARGCFCPCVWNQQVFLGPGNSCGVIEVFDPVAALCHVAMTGFEPGFTVLVPVSEEEIVVLAGDVTRYFPNEMRKECIHYDDVSYNCPGGAITYSGKSYFAIRKDKSYWSVRFLDANKEVVKVKKIYN